MSQYIYENIKTYAEINNTPINVITNTIGVTKAEMQSWQANAPINKILLIAQLLNVSAPDLLENPDPEPNSASKDDSEFEKIADDSNNDQNRYSDKELKNVQLPLVKLMEINDRVYIDTGLEWENRDISDIEKETTSEQVLQIKYSIERYNFSENYADFIYGWHKPLITFNEFKNKLQSMLGQLEPYHEEIYNPAQTKLYVKNLNEAIRPVYEDMYAKMINEPGEE